MAPADARAPGAERTSGPSQWPPLPTGIAEAVPNEAAARRERREAWRARSVARAARAGTRCTWASRARAGMLAPVNPYSASSSSHPSTCARTNGVGAGSGEGARAHAWLPPCAARAWRRSPWIAWRRRARPYATPVRARGGAWWRASAAPRSGEASRPFAQLRGGRDGHGARQGAKPQTGRSHHQPHGWRATSRPSDAQPVLGVHVAARASMPHIRLMATGCDW